MNTKTTKNTKRKLKNLNTKIKKLGQTIKKKNRRNNRVRRLANRFRMPAAQTKSFKRIFNITSQDGNSMTVKGRDLVYAIPDNLNTNNETPVITVIPANPCYWIGTRVAALAAGYQNYRPLLFKVTYVPQCAVTQQGNVIAGTLWHTLPSTNNFQQTLRTSPGGMMTQCYKTFTSNVTMRSNLQFNLFRCAGKFDQESNPFIFMAISVACINSQGNKIIPGYFYIDYAYTFKNPIGLSHAFYNTGITTTNDVLNRDDDNMAAISCSITDNPSIGAIIQIDKDDDGALVFSYNDTEVPMRLGQPLWFFGNTALDTLNAPVVANVRLNPELGDREITTQGFEFNFLRDQAIMVDCHPRDDPENRHLIFTINTSGNDIQNYIASVIAEWGVIDAVIAYSTRAIDYNNPQHNLVTFNRPVKSFTIYRGSQTTTALEAHYILPEQSIVERVPTSYVPLGKRKLKLIKPEPLKLQPVKEEIKENLIDEEEEDEEEVKLIKIPKQKPKVLK
jgi:hypothetical protein